MAIRQYVSPMPEYLNRRWYAPGTVFLADDASVPSRWMDANAAAVAQTQADANRVGPPSGGAGSFLSSIIKTFIPDYNAGPTLGTPTLTGTLLAGTALSGVTLSGLADGSTVAFNIAGISVGTSGASRTVTGTPAAAGSLAMTETLAGAGGSPKTTTVGSVGTAPLPVRNAVVGVADPNGLAALGTGNTLIQYRTMHVVEADTTSLMLDEALFYVDGANYTDTRYLPDNGAVLNAALEIGTVAAGTASSAFLPFAFAGQSTYTSNGAETGYWVSSDPILSSAFGLSKFTKGDVLWVRRAWQFAATRSWLANDVSDSTVPESGEQCRVATDTSFNKVNGSGGFTGTAGTAAANSRFLRPLALRGPISGVSVKGMGDSIMDGKGGNRNGIGAATNTTGGAYARAYYLAAFPFQKSGRDGNRIQNLTAAKCPARFAQLAAGWYSHVHCNMGTNDLNDTTLTISTTLANLDSAINAIKAQKSDIKVVWDRILARTGSTDSWATTANQTVQQRNTANQFGPNPDAGTGTDIVAAFRAGLASRVSSGALSATTNGNAGWADSTSNWLVGVNGTANYPTVDGTHPTLAKQNDIATALSGQLSAALSA